MAEAFIGEIRLLPYNFTPQFWFPCDGRLISVQQYPVLFAILGIYYGGDGKVNFALPDLRGRCAVGVGDDPQDTFDLSRPGLTGGNESVVLQTYNIPQHTHTLSGATQPAAVRTNLPTNNYIGQVIRRTLPSGTNVNAFSFYDDATVQPTTVAMNAGTISPYMGKGAAHENRQPFLALQYCICHEGYFPARN